MSSLQSEASPLHCATTSVVIVQSFGTLCRAECRRLWRPNRWRQVPSRYGVQNLVGGNNDQMKHRQRDAWLRFSGLMLAGCSSLLIATVSSAEARITSLTNCTTTSPYGSTSLGTAGTYEQLACTANGTVDPNDPLNGIIQDIKLAPKVSGRVQYSMDVTILRPTDHSKSNHVMLFDVPNRDNRLLPRGFNIGGSITSAGEGFLHS
jgi:hypothetical protein